MPTYAVGRRRDETEMDMRMLPIKKLHVDDVPLSRLRCEKVVELVGEDIRIHELGAVGDALDHRHLGRIGTRESRKDGPDALGESRTSRNSSARSSSAHADEARMVDVPLDFIEAFDACLREMDVCRHGIQLPCARLRGTLSAPQYPICHH